MEKEYLTKQIEWFESNRESLLKENEGKWVVVHDQTLVGIYDTFDEAYRNGIEKTKSEEMLIKQITEKDEPIQMSISLLTGLINVPTNP